MVAYRSRLSNISLHVVVHVLDHMQKTAYVSITSCHNRRKLAKIPSFAIWIKLEHEEEKVVKMDLARRAGETSTHQCTFRGEPANTAVEAQGNAAQAALTFLCTRSNIVIDGYNYAALRTATASPLFDQQWANTRERQLSRTRQQLAELHNEYTNKMKALRKSASSSLSSSQCRHT
ncbi:unnamed protein product [Alopecurus aequalis]